MTDAVEKLFFTRWLRKLSLVVRRYRIRAGGTAISRNILCTTLRVKLTAITDPISEQIGFCQKIRTFKIPSFSTASVNCGPDTFLTFESVVGVEADQIHPIDLQQYASSVVDEQFSISNVAGKHCVGGMSCLLPDLP